MDDGLEEPEDQKEQAKNIQAHIAQAQTRFKNTMNVKNTDNNGSNF